MIKDKKNSFFKYILISVILIFISSVYVAVQVNSPVNENSPDKIFIVKKGNTLNRISTNLEKNGIIKSVTLFKLVAKITGKSESFKHGQYLIRGTDSILDITNILNSGVSMLSRVTIREGLRMSEIFSLLEKAGFGKAKQYRKLSKDKKFIQQLGIDSSATSLEGFLFPDTYSLSKEAKERRIIQKMVSTFFEKLPENYGQLAKKVGLTSYQAITLASIIEKETGAASERAIISSVFHNRLKKDMRLATDPAVIYGIKNFNGNLTRKDLRTMTPYNTYRKKGLTPTPIANPGLDALMAAVHPGRTDFLFFVAMGNGKHKFSKTFKEHNRAVNKYQRNRKSKKKYRSY